MFPKKQSESKQKIAELVKLVRVICSAAVILGYVCT